MQIFWAWAALAMAFAPLDASATPTSAEYAAARVSEQRGEEMFAYDQAAWHATDRIQEDMRRRGLSLDALQAKGMQGYIVEPGEGGTLLATFYGEIDGQRFAIASYTVTGSTVTGGGFIEADGVKGLSLLAQRMIDARQKAVKAMHKPDHELCSQSPPNTLVLPPQVHDGALPVYVLTSTTESDMYPAGGHYRFDFGSNGKLIGERRFMKSCFNLDYSPKDGIRPEILVLTHLLDPQPTEVHAFVSRNVPFQLVIVTTPNQSMWRVGHGQIEYVSDVPDKN